MTVTATATPSKPSEAVEGFLALLEAGDLAALANSLCRDACFLTQDATTIQGRESIAALLAQLQESGLRVTSLTSHSLWLGDFALVTTRWKLHLPAQPRPLLQTTEAMLALARREGRWKLLLIAPWGWPGSRHGNQELPLRPQQEER